MQARTSEILRTLARSEERTVAVGDIVEAMGSRAHGIGLILFALPESIPLPLPSLSTVLGIPLVLLALHLVLFGEDSGLPRRVLTARIHISTVRRVARLVGRVLEWLELATLPRWGAVLRNERIIGIVCLYLSIVLLLPIPFVNFAPAVCLIAIALGMVQRDGLVALIGLAGTAALTFVLSYFTEVLAGLLQNLFAALRGGAV